MPTKQQNFFAIIVPAVLIGLAALWLRPASAQTVTVPVQPRTVTVPALQLILSPQQKTLNTGESMQLDALITNSGDGTATGVVLSVSVPDGIRLTPSKNSGRWEVQAIPAGTTKTVTLTASADQGMEAGNIMFKASVLADGVADVSATSTIAVKQGAVKGATTDGAGTLAELPKTGTSAIPYWIGGGLMAAGIAGLYRLRLRNTLLR